MSATTVDVSGCSEIYQSLLNSVAQKYSNIGEQEDDASLIPEIKRLLELGENEASLQSENRWFSALSALIDKVGACKVMMALAKVFEDRSDDGLAGPVNQILSEACMRHETEFRGQRYSAHLMLVPLVFRGDLPSSFPSILDQSVVANMQVILQRSFESLVSHGGDALVVPGNALYTMDEFRNTPIDFFHNILAKVAQTCRENANISRPCLAMMMDSSTHGVMDESLVDVSEISVFTMANPASKNDNPAVFTVAELPRGLWITVKLLPIIVLWPRNSPESARWGPEIGHLGPFAQAISQCIALCGQPENKSLEGSMGLQVSALGIFAPLAACLRARMVLTRETLIGNLLRSLPFIEVEKLRVRFVYTLAMHLLEVTIENGTINGGLQAYLPHSAQTELYIEQMAEELICLGISCEVNLGDGMLRIPQKRQNFFH